jgi:drug/metabolite transporter (DMT)-like permease
MLSGYLLLVLFTLLGALGAFFLKRATSRSATIPGTLRDSNLYIGGAFYFSSAVINIIVLQMLPYVVVLPCSSITYVWSLYLSRTFLKEYVGMAKIIGISSILFGVVLIALA